MKEHLRQPAPLRGAGLLHRPGPQMLAADEIVTHIDIPAPPPRTAKVYLKHGRRAQMELATVGVAVRLTLDDGGSVSDLAIVLAAVAPTPLRAVRAEALLRGRRLTTELLAATAQAASEEARPIGDVRGSADYRREMVRVLTRRALDATRGPNFDGIRARIDKDAMARAAALLGRLAGNKTG